MNTVRLHSASLLSKYGFNDGDDPEEWLDWCEGNGIDLSRARINSFPLAAAVKKFLVPLIEQDITVTELVTAHNPVRIQTLDGHDMTGVWHGTLSEPELTPAYVDVPMTEILKLAQEEGLV